MLEALAQGVLQVAIPVTNDQPGVAARIADKKSGLFVSLKELTAPRPSHLVDEVLNDLRIVIMPVRRIPCFREAEAKLLIAEAIVEPANKP